MYLLRSVSIWVFMVAIPADRSYCPSYQAFYGTLHCTVADHWQLLLATIVYAFALINLALATFTMVMPSGSNAGMLVHIGFIAFFLCHAN